MRISLNSIYYQNIFDSNKISSNIQIPYLYNKLFIWTQNMNFVHFKADMFFYIIPGLKLSFIPSNTVKLWSSCRQLVYKFNEILLKYFLAFMSSVSTHPGNKKNSVNVKRDHNICINRVNWEYAKIIEEKFSTCGLLLWGPSPRDVIEQSENLYRRQNEQAEREKIPDIFRWWVEMVHLTTTQFNWMQIVEVIRCHQKIFNDVHLTKV